MFIVNFHIMNKLHCFVTKIRGKIICTHRKMCFMVNILSCMTYNFGCVLTVTISRNELEVYQIWPQFLVKEMFPRLVQCAHCPKNVGSTNLCIWSISLNILFRRNISANWVHFQVLILSRWSIFKVFILGLSS